MAKGGHLHRGTLKKDHKPFKSKHATKGSLKAANKGKVEKSGPGASKQIKVASKLQRKNTARQLKEHKILTTKAARSLFEGALAAERVVVVIALTNDLDPSEIAARLVAAAGGDVAEPFEGACVRHVAVPRFRAKFSVVVPDHGNLLDILDAAKAADFVVFGLSAQEEIQPDHGEQILRAVVAQGVATAVGVVPNLVASFPKRNLQQDVRQSLQSYFGHFFPDDEKLFALDSDAEAANCARYVAQKFPKPVNWRDLRGYLLVKNVALSPDGHVVAEGTVRGAGFTADRLVHIPGHGDFQLAQIEAVARNEDEKAVFSPTVMQDSLDELNPEEAEMDAADDGLDDDEPVDHDSHGVRMQGKNYFGAEKQPLRLWVLDDDEDDEIDAQDEDAQDDDAMEEVSRADGDDMADEEAGDENGADGMFVELSPEEEERQWREYKSLEQEDREFPDEIELAPEDSAVSKLKDYRGVKSLGSCDWDWDEQDAHKPDVYLRLLQIRNFKASKNRAAKDAVRDSQVHAGAQVRLYIRAPASVLEAVDVLAKPLVVYSLLAHERKLAVTNFSFKTWENYENPVPSGESLIAQYGFRRVQITPQFSQDSNHANNVHKFERFAHQGDTCIALAITAPLLYNAPTIFFRESASGTELVGQGTLLNCDHTRVMAERVVLTGHPVKIHRRLVTVRYMFFRPEDINWFKAVPLFTKSGRTGFIKESLGTHGYFKATFDGRLSAQDIVAMPLYRRVWPA